MAKASAFAIFNRGGPNCEEKKKSSSVFIYAPVIIEHNFNLFNSCYIQCYD